MTPQDCPHRMLVRELAKVKGKLPLTQTQVLAKLPALPPMVTWEMEQCPLLHPSTTTIVECSVNLELPMMLHWAGASSMAHRPWIASTEWIWIEFAHF